MAGGRSVRLALVLGQWLLAVGRHWVTIVAGAAFAVAALFGAPERLLILCAFGSVLWASFLAWRDVEAARSEFAQKQAERLKPRVRLTTAIEPRGEVIRDGTQYRDCCLLWVTVHNDGPDGEWQARFGNLTGLPGGDHSPHLGWEESSTENRYIARGGSERLRLAMRAFGRHAPHAVFGFFLPESPSWSRGQGHAINIMNLNSDTVTLDLSLHDKVSGHTVLYKIELSELRADEPKISPDQGTVLDT